MYTSYPACAAWLKCITVLASFTAAYNYVLQHPAMHYGMLEQHVTCPTFFSVHTSAALCCELQQLDIRQIVFLLCWAMLPDQAGVNKLLVELYFNEPTNTLVLAFCLNHEKAIGSKDSKEPVLDNPKEKTICTR